MYPVSSQDVPGSENRPGKLLSCTFPILIVDITVRRLSPDMSEPFHIRTSIVHLYLRGRLLSLPLRLV